MHTWPDEVGERTTEGQRTFEVEKRGTCTCLSWQVMRRGDTCTHAHLSLARRGGGEDDEGMRGWRMCGGEDKVGEDDVGWRTFEVEEGGVGERMGGVDDRGEDGTFEVEERGGGEDNGGKDDRGEDDRGEDDRGEDNRGEDNMGQRMFEVEEGGVHTLVLASDKEGGCMHTRHLLDERVCVCLVPTRVQTIQKILEVHPDSPWNPRSPSGLQMEWGGECKDLIL
ncbi:hypothetical protein BDQ17DRAFT_1331276 [Cyathus striatus]|nr:hypothetical protein BDQ17DRAFT_1331276 [Cyathus striatus]